MTYHHGVLEYPIRNPHSFPFARVYVSPHITTDDRLLIIRFSYDLSCMFEGSQPCYFFAAICSVSRLRHINVQPLKYCIKLSEVMQLRSIQR